MILARGKKGLIRDSTPGNHDPKISIKGRSSNIRWENFSRDWSSVGKKPERFQMRLRTSLSHQNGSAPVSRYQNSFFQKPPVERMFIYRSTTFDSVAYRREIMHGILLSSRSWIKLLLPVPDNPVLAASQVARL